MSNINEANIGLSPVDVFFGLRNKDTVTTVADSSGSLNSTFFQFDSTDIDGTSTLYYVWYDVNSLGVDPAPSGRTGITVLLATDATAATVATATDAAMTADSGSFSNSVTGSVVTIESGAMGLVTAAADGSAATSFTIASVTTGEKFEFGATDDVSFSTEFTYTDVTASQLGNTLLDQIQNGNNVTVTVPAKEVVAALFQETIGDVAGDILTVGTDKIVGIGESKRFTNMKALSKELMLRPANETDLTNTWVAWRAKPDLTGLNFSGSDVQVAEIEFSAYRDSARPSKVSLAAFGKSDKGMLA